jgi:hypothetical protein
MTKGQRLVLRGSANIGATEGSALRRRALRSGGADVGPAWTGQAARLSAVWMPRPTEMSKAR